MEQEQYNPEELSNIIYLHDADGAEVAFEFLDLIEYDGEKYVVLLPTDGDDGQVVILQLEETDGEFENYLAVDEEVMMAVFEIFKEKFRDQFQFTE